MQTIGISQPTADSMDITVVAVLLGVPAPGPDQTAIDLVYQPQSGRPKRPDGTPVPATVPDWVRRRRKVNDSAMFRRAVDAASRLEGTHRGSGALEG